MKGNTGIALTLVAAATLLAIGCGQEKIEQASAGSAAPPAVVAQNIDPVVPTGSAGGTTQEGAATSADSLPPEVSASLSDTLVAPGGIVEITAEASEDVVEVSLRDDLGRKQPFAYDAGAKLWRTTYRVPMRIPAERLGLSVTARNGSSRWCRVWVFLGVHREAPAQP